MWSQQTKAILLHIVALIVVCECVLPGNKILLFSSFDGCFFKTLIRQHFMWTQPRLYFTNSPLQGLGNIDFPNNFQLMPCILMGSLQNHAKLSPVAVYLSVSLELFLAVIFLSRSFNISLYPSLIAAWLTIICSQPFMYPWPLYIVSWLAPHFFESVAAQCVVLGLFVRIGKEKCLNALIQAVTAAIILFWSMITIPLSIFISLPVFLIVLLVLVVLTDNRRERLWKIGFLAVTLILMLPTVVPFVLGLILYTVPATYGNELFNDRAGLQSASILFYGIRDWSQAGWLGLWLFSAGVTASIGLLRTKEQQYRVIAVTTLTLAICFALVGSMLTIIIISYRGTMPIYWEVYAWPFYFIAVSTAAVLILKAICRKFPMKISRQQLGCLLILIIPLVTIFWRAKISALYHERHYPPQSNRIVDSLVHSVGLKLGSEFRGSVATFTGYNNKPKITWYDQYNYDEYLQAADGNDFRSIGLWYYEIPTLFEYDPLITPPYYLMMSRLLSRPQDKQIRNVITLSCIHPGYLASLGVRFVITDDSGKTPEKMKEVTQLKSHTGTCLRLLELEQPNLGNYSPTKVLVAGCVGKAMRWMRSADFDFSTQCVMNEPAPSKLVKTSSSMIFFNKDGMHVAAQSNGSSLLLLPLQYSHCLELKIIQGSTKQSRLVRLNILQAGLLFSGKVEAVIQFRCGIFNNPYERLHDYLDVKRLGI